MLPLPPNDQKDADRDADLRQSWDHLSDAVFRLMKERDTWITRHHRQKLDAQTTDDDYRKLENERDTAIHERDGYIAAYNVADKERRLATRRAEALEAELAETVQCLNNERRIYMRLERDEILRGAPPAADHTERARKVAAELVHRIGHNQPKNYDAIRIAAELIAAALAEERATAERAGAEQMRERAVQIAAARADWGYDSRKEKHVEAGTIAYAIRALPLPGEE